ncbi:hypothetical protein AB0M00_43715 [Streptomyces chartreusis]|uniref:hypothetical protein n=1 Tax=Streptomyces chartreusis TaxID=1969 RepID=UPI0034248228
MDITLTDAVFNAAATAAHWTSTNLGPRTEISHAGYTWTVELPADGQGNARIAGRYGHAGTELLDVQATPLQTIGIVEAAMSALRAPIDAAEDTQRWEVEDFGAVLSVHDSEPAAKERVRQLLLIGSANPGQLSVQWKCPVCEGSGECPDCASARPGQQMAFLHAEGCAPVPSSFLVRPAA